jgi:hypothetical protein
MSFTSFFLNRVGKAIGALQATVGLRFGDDILVIVRLLAQGVITLKNGA